MGDRPPRVVISGVAPEIEGGRFPVKRSAGERLAVEADVFADGHDELHAVVRHRREGEASWDETTMEPLGNDRWRGVFHVGPPGVVRYTVAAWVDPFRSWRRGLGKKAAAATAGEVDLLVGAALLEATARRAGDAGERLAAWAARLGDAAVPLDERIRVALADEVAAAAALYPDPGHGAVYGRELAAVVDRAKARFSAWYELFPRSAGPPGRHGTFADVIARLPYVAGMGFDVLYLPPIHPIGRVHRKGRNNVPAAGPGDPGSPWAIGAAEGGHTAVHPELGTLEDFRALVAAAEELGLEVALDLAFQCAPDHPWVAEHPEWFRWRPDGTVQHAENPPKVYQDILPLDFDSAAWESLWQALLDVALFWVGQGVRIFRVDNPHTKPFAFWEWFIAQVKGRHPDVLFLSEAFTRPKVMYRLAKVGFTQSYTYFAWRTTKAELTSYFHELTRPAVCEYFRPNLWPNTPDILTEYLQVGGRPAFAVRAVLAATLGASWGIYGPAFELTESRALEPGSEEYLGSEKYEIRHWDLDAPGSLRGLVAALNRIRRDNPALHRDPDLRFHAVDNDELVCYSKSSPAKDNVIVVVVNLDPHHVQSGWVELPLRDLGLDGKRGYQVHDLLTDTRFLWHGPRNYVALDPAAAPAHVFRVRRWLRSERDFEYYL